MAKTFVYVDVSKKQDFIFKSNKLKENLKNSYIIKLITEYDDLQSHCKDEVSLNNYMIKCGAKEEFCGGGNSIISFENEERAKEFIREYSREVLKAYPDLELYLSKLVKENDDKFSKDDYNELIKEANRLKEKRKSRYDKISFGVEKIDEETGLPIEIEDEKSKTQAENRKVEMAREYLRRALDLLDNSEIEVTSKMQDYKSPLNKYSNTEKDDVNYIGIISIDGNGMGDLMKKIKEVEKQFKVGKEIKRIYFDAVSDYLKELEAFNEEKIKKYVTPIVSAGDDLCLILDGRIAIDAAAKIIDNIRNKSIASKAIRETKEISGQVLTACAGVAIVKAVYPFFDAYREAEKMCREAKKYLHKIKEKDKYFSIIDWKIVQGSNIEANDFLENIKIEDEKYHIKPLVVDVQKSYYDSSHDTYVFSYEDFKNLSKKINEKIDKDKISKSTLRKLQESFYSGFKSYEFDIKARDKEYTEYLFDIFKDYFEGENIENKLGTVKTPSGERIYVLNDIINALKFLTTI